MQLQHAACVGSCAAGACAQQDEFRVRHALPISEVNDAGVDAAAHHTSYQNGLGPVLEPVPHDLRVRVHARPPVA